MYKLICAASTCAAVFTFSGNVWAQTATIKPGLWEFSVTNQVVGKDAKRKMVSQVCYFATDVETPDRSMPPQHEFGMKCSVKDYKATGDTAKWQVSCTGKSNSYSGLTTVTIKPESYEGQATLSSQSAGKGVKINQIIEAKRVSGC